jgi:hypothetical protein
LSGIPTSIRLPELTRRALRKEAKATHRDVSNLMLWIIESWLTANDKWPRPSAGRVPEKPDVPQRCHGFGTASANQTPTDGETDDQG